MDSFEAEIRAFDLNFDAWKIVLEYSGRLQKYLYFSMTYFGVEQ